MSWMEDLREHINRPATKLDALYYALAIGGLITGHFWFVWPIALAVSIWLGHSKKSTTARAEEATK